MTYQHNFECPVCECRETVWDHGEEVCVECGLPLSEFIPAPAEVPEETFFYWEDDDDDW